MSGESQGRARAEAFRTKHSLGVLPLGDLVALIELTQGIDVAILDAEPDEHGMTMRDPVRGAVIVAAARTRNPMRQRSSLAHELGHLLFGDCAPPKASGWDARSSQEIRADAFARHLLVPVEGVRSILGGRDSVTLSHLSVLVQRFLASPSVVAIQLQQAGYIDDPRKKEWMTQTTPRLASRFGWSDQYHGLQEESNQRRAPQRLLSRAIEGYLANAVSLQSIARLRGVSAEVIEQEFAEAGIAPVEQAVLWGRPDNLPAAGADLSDLDEPDTEAETHHE